MKSGQKDVKNNVIVLTTSKDRIGYLMTLPTEYLTKMFSFLSQMHRSGIGKHPILEYEFRSLDNGDISLVLGIIQSILDNVVSQQGLKLSPSYAERQFIVGDNFKQFFSEVSEVVEKRKKKDSAPLTYINFDVCNDIKKVYRQIKITDDLDKGKMKLVGVGSYEIPIGRLNEQKYILVKNVLRHHGKPQNVEGVHFTFTNTKKTTKQFKSPKNTSAYNKEIFDHLVEIISEVNRSVKNDTAIPQLISYKKTSGNEIEIYFNLNLG